MDGRKRRGETAQDCLKFLGLQFVELNPLTEDSVRLKFAAREVEKFGGKETGSARDPGIRRLGNDDVVFFVGHQQMISRVVDHQVDTFVVKRIAVVIMKEPAGFYDRVLQLDAFDSFVRMAQHRAQRDTAPQADDHHPVLFGGSSMGISPEKSGSADRRI